MMKVALRSAPRPACWQTVPHDTVAYLAFAQ